jgi:hypothetical protein
LPRVDTQEKIDLYCFSFGKNSLLGLDKAEFQTRNHPEKPGLSQKIGICPYFWSQGKPWLQAAPI